MPSLEDSMTIRAAGAADAGVIAALINSAFQVESFFIDGDRISVQEVQRLLNQGSFLLIEDARGLSGCVYVEIPGEHAYLGLLSVSPERQREGLGRQLVAAAEERARQSACKFMTLRVVNLRAELPPFYRKIGYEETGAEPFPSEVRTKLPCHFVIMSKRLT